MVVPGCFNSNLASTYYAWYFMESSPQPFDLDSIVPILQVRRLRGLQAVTCQTTHCLEGVALRLEDKGFSDSKSKAFTTWPSQCFTGRL